MDIIKRLKNQKIFVFKTFKTTPEEKLQLWERIEESIGNEKISPFEGYKRINSIKGIAAAITIVIGLSWLIFEFEKTDEEQTPVATIVKAVKNGEKLTVTLMDGSTVKLNSSSHISYPEQFSDDNREVILEGEAFFDIRKNPEKPFIVRTGSVSTTVLGTSFNINAYPEEDRIEVALVTGRVRLESQLSPGEIETVYLTPNNKAVFSKDTKSLEVDSFEKEDVLAWKDGTIVFKKASQTEVLETLERWYGVEFRINNESPKPWDLTTRFENNNLEYVLNVISYTAQFDYTIENKVVYINY